jgi:hypothetical protein
MTAVIATRFSSLQTYIFAGGNEGFAALQGELMR